MRVSGKVMVRCAKIKSVARQMEESATGAENIRHAQLTL